MTETAKPDLPPPYEACAHLIAFTGGKFVLDTPFRQVVAGTVLRSRATFIGVCSLVEIEIPQQAAMLARALFEDVAVAHWVMLNEDDPTWLIDRFFRHRDAIALHQRRLSQETAWRVGAPIVSDPESLLSRQNALTKEFGAEAQKDWWDPGAEGRGRGRPIGLRGIVACLEDAATRHVRFYPRFAGGDEPLLVRMERVVQKWFNQYLHHTAVGLPFNATPDGVDPAHNPTEHVLFCSYWMFAQQAYLLHELYGRDLAEFEELYVEGLKDGFGPLFGADPGLIRRVH